MYLHICIGINGLGQLQQGPMHQKFTIPPFGGLGKILELAGLATLDVTFLMQYGKDWE